MLIEELLRVSIGQALVGVVTYANKPIPVYHNTPDDAIKPYIEIIGQSSAKDKQNKDGKAFQSIVPIRVMTGYVGGAGGNLQADRISEQVINLLDEVLEVDGYSILNTEYSTINLNNEFGNEFQTNKIINFSFTISQN